jgi:hypothetical protein
MKLTASSMPEEAINEVRRTRSEVGASAGLLHIVCTSEVATTRAMDHSTRLPCF